MFTCLSQLLSQCANLPNYITYITQENMSQENMEKTESDRKDILLEEGKDSGVVKVLLMSDL